jgi:hypothetical protein
MMCPSGASGSRLREFVAVAVAVAVNDHVNDHVNVNGGPS